MSRSGRQCDIRWPSGRVGRPKLMEGGKRINIYLDSASLETAAKLGGGITFNMEQHSGVNVPLSEHVG